VAGMTSSQALMFYTAVMAVTYILTIWFTNLPFLAFATQMTLAFIAFITKRLISKKQEYK
jgi:hypothetical protein